MFQHVDAYAGDPILTLNEAFGRDARAHKINLSIGIYFDDEGRVPVLASVRAAEAQMLAAAATKSYLPIEGDATMRRAVQALLFGADHPVLAEGRVATLQTVGSSGGLKVGADFLRTWLPEAGVWVSDPTWDNHRSMFEGSGFTVHTYPYYDASSGGVRFDAMLAQGLLDEVRGLRARGDLQAGLPSMRCVGYRQAWAALDEGLEGEALLAAVRERGIAATRQLAKRQLTWLRKWPDLNWIYTDGAGNLAPAPESDPVAMAGGQTPLELALNYLDMPPL